jgi:hypothetical protein
MHIGLFFTGIAEYGGFLLLRLCFISRFPLKLFYMCQCGFHIYSIPALLMRQTRRKDFTVMMSHHVITVFLIGYSYITRYTL